VDRMITMHARPRQTDIQTDEHHSNSATIRALKRVYGRNRKAAKAAFTSVTAKQTIAYMYKHNINNEMWNTHTHAHTPVSLYNEVKAHMMRDCKGSPHIGPQTCRR